VEHTKKFDTFTKFAEADAVQLESPEKEWLDQVYEKIETKMQWVSEKSKDKIPFYRSLYGAIVMATPSSAFAFMRRYKRSV